MSKILISFFLNLFIFMVIYSFLISCLKTYRRNSVIVISFDTLADITRIIERGKIYVKNKQDATLYDYVNAHISEQELIPAGIVNALNYQRLGYKLVFISSRPEEVRKETAALLNTWRLRGELYMDNGEFGWTAETTLKIKMIRQLKECYKIVDIIDDDASFIKEALKLNF